MSKVARSAAKWRLVRRLLGLPNYVGVERIIGDQSPLLPISFLEIGLERARAVARIVCPDGVGTGFLIRDNLLITNNHVISKPEEAREARIQLGFR